MNTSGIRWCDAVPVKDITSISRVEADALTAKQLYDFTLPSGITLEEHYSDTPKPKIGVGTRLRHANDGSEVLIVRTEYSEVAAIRYNGESWGFRKPAKDWRNLTMDEAASILGSWNLEKFTII